MKSKKRTRQAEIDQIYLHDKMSEMPYPMKGYKMEYPPVLWDNVKEGEEVYSAYSNTGYYAHTVVKVDAGKNRALLKTPWGKEIWTDDESIGNYIGPCYVPPKADKGIRFVKPINLTEDEISSLREALHVVAVDKTQDSAKREKALQLAHYIYEENRLVTSLKIEL